MRVPWTQTVADELQVVRSYFARSDPVHAQVLVGRLVTRADVLDGQPWLGAEVPEYGDSEIREVYEHPYRISYRVDGSDVLVVAVIHSSRRLPRTPPG